MKVHVTQYTGIAVVDGVTVPIGKNRLGGESKTSAGSFTALNADCRIIRVRTDTAIHFNPNGAADTTHDLILSEDWIVIGGAWTPQFIAA